MKQNGFPLDSVAGLHENQDLGNLCLFLFSGEAKIFGFFGNLELHRISLQVKRTTWHVYGSGSTKELNAMNWCCRTAYVLAPLKASMRVVVVSWPGHLLVIKKPSRPIPVTCTLRSTGRVKYAFVGPLNGSPRDSGSCAGTDGAVVKIQLFLKAKRPTPPPKKGRRGWIGCVLVPARGR